MPENQEHMLDQALARLLDGASLSSLVAEYPDLREELQTHASLLSALREVKSAMPSESGLNAALAAMPSAAPAPVMPTPSPYLAAFMTYRTAFVLPVLVLMLTLGGFFVYPNLATAPRTETPQGQEPVSSQPQGQSEAAGSGAQGSAPNPTPAPNPKAKTAPAGSENSGEGSPFMLMTAPADMSTSTATSTPTTTPSGE